MTARRGSAAGVRHALSPAERDIVLHLANGWRYADIARLRGRSVKTVKTQALNAMRKYGAHTQAELVACYLTETFGKPA